LQSGECMYVCPTEMSFEFHQITKHCIPKWFSQCCQNLKSNIRSP
jgi:hypothetical protein